MDYVFSLPSEFISRDFSKGELFAMCPINGPTIQYVEPVTDSSRYFVVRIEDGRGNYFTFLLDLRTRQYCSFVRSASLTRVLSYLRNLFALLLNIQPRI